MTSFWRLASIKINARACPPILTFRHIRTMSTKNDTTLQSDITKSIYEPDGSFKRQPSAFRNFIEKGGRFEAESGE
jgi:hypothetical protein